MHLRDILDYPKWEATKRGYPEERKMLLLEYQPDASETKRYSPTLDRDKALVKLGNKP